MKRLLVAAGGLVLVIGGVVAVRSALHRGKTAIDRTLVVKVQRADLDVLVTETGKIEPKAKAELKSKVAGQVIKVYVQEGEAVRKGQRLIQLDPIDFERAVAQARADLAQNKAQLAYSEAQLARRTQALEGRGVSQADYETSKNDVAVNRARTDLSQVNLDMKLDQLHYTTLTSPLDGVVTQRGIEPGEVVTPGVTATFEGKPLLVVADLTELKVKVNLNQIDVAKLKLSQDVEVSVDALPGQVFHARVTKVAPASVAEKNKEVEFFPVEATIDGPLKPGESSSIPRSERQPVRGLDRDKGAAGGGRDGGVARAVPTLKDIRPGMTADVKIRVDRKKSVLVLPIEAVSSEKAKQFGREMGVEKNWVTVVEHGEHGDTTRKVDVKVGERNDRDVEVLTGVSEGQEILIQPPAADANEVKM
jgi:HlyD family secretion protein/macrolide-specific efflux system membrane fusion protein